MEPEYAAKGEPLTRDFGIVRIWHEANDGATSKNASSGGTIRYAAPRPVEINGACETTRSNPYSIEILILERIVGEIPPSHVTRDAVALHTRIVKRQYTFIQSSWDIKNCAIKFPRTRTCCWAIKLAGYESTMG